MCTCNGSNDELRLSHRATIAIVPCNYAQTVQATPAAFVGGTFFN